MQFDALFTDDLYLAIGKNAIETAAVLKEGLKKKGYQFFIDSPTNQQFVVLENSRMEELKKDVQFGFCLLYTSYLTSMIGYLFIFFILLLTGIYFSAYQLSGGYSKFETTLSALTFVFLIGVPILSMRVLAEERKQKTDVYKRQL